jgi:lipopolysaccharide biosynthesis protein
MPKLIAFHLPQFHRIPENDDWWGESFTEWTNVRKARPLYPGHPQPAVPLDSYYYDLTDPSARDWQARLARDHGIHGFCYYHYWFNGRKILEKPCEAILESGSPDFPFCFSWANESWTRAWDGATQDVLLQQHYGCEADWKTHFDYLLPFFQDRRYITHEGRPMFLIYRPGHFPGVSQMLACWDRWARDAGLPGMFFVKTLTAFDDRPDAVGFSAAVSFEPWHTIVWGASLARRGRWWLQRAACRALTACGFPQRFLYSYDDIWNEMLRAKYSANVYRGAFSGWDNTPRRGDRARVVAGSTPEKFGGYIKRQLTAATRDGSEFVFVNAWNEWAEGAYLEPDERHGSAYLEQLKAAVESCKALSQTSNETQPPRHD